MGAGSVSRFDIGLVIASGMLIGTLFTLFVIPTMYLLNPRKIVAFLFSAGLLGTILYLLIY